MPKEQITVSTSKKKDLRKQLLDIGDGNVGRELFYLIKSRYKVIYVRSPEELRVIQAFKLISQSEGYNLFQWDLSRGLLESFSMESVSSEGNEVNDNPEALLDHIISQAKSDNAKMDDGKVQANGGNIFMLLDFHHFLESAPLIERKIKEFSGFPSVSCIIIISPVFVCPAALTKEFNLIDFPHPSMQEIKRSLDVICSEVPANFPKARAVAQEREEDLLKAARGLTISEAENAYAKSLIKTKTFDIPTILDEKKQIIRKGGIIECRDARFTFDQVGGLGALKEWLQYRKMAFREDAAAFGLDPPKGVLLVGIPGTGKSMTADALSDLYEMPLLRLDMGALFSAHVGESEENTRNAIEMAESISPCILWIDEIEKGIGGVQSSNQTDGGVTSRVFGTLLTWMQEKVVPVFVVATANNVHSIPPEFMRAGRFDEIFFLDLPSDVQREDILACLLKKKGRKPNDFDLEKIAKQSPNYSPAELEKGINNALFLAYADKTRELTTDDIVSEIGKFQPLYNSRREEIEEMRSWALGDGNSGGRARLANAEPQKEKKKHVVKNTPRQIDLSNADL